MAEQVDGYKEYSFDRTIYTILLIINTPHDDKIKYGNG